MSYSQKFYKVKIENDSLLWWNLILPTLPANSVIVHYSYTLYEHDGKSIVDILNPAGSNVDSVADSKKIPLPVSSNKGRKMAFVFTIVGAVEEDYKILLEVKQGSETLTNISVYSEEQEEYIKVEKIKVSGHYATGAIAAAVFIELT